MGLLPLFSVPRARKSEIISGFWRPGSSHSVFVSVDRRKKQAHINIYIFIATMPLVKQEEEEAMDIDSGRPIEDHEDDDPVVREMDIFVAPEISQQMYLLQYPLEQNRITLPGAARIKTNCGLIELDFLLPDDIHRQGDYNTINQRTFDSQTVTVQTHMCIGKISKETNGNDTFTLVPLYRICQMRPNFSHMKQTHEDGPESMSEDEEAGSEELNEVMPVVYRRKEADRAITARKQSYAYKLEMEAQEEWQHLEISDTDEVRAKYLSMMLCPPSHQRAAYRHISKERYIQSLSYSQNAGEENQQKGKHELIRELSVLLGPGWPIPYSLLRAKTAPYDEDTFLYCVKFCAVLVQNLFFLNSRFVRASKRIQDARTFLLMLFETCRSVHRQVLSKIPVSGECVSEDHWIVLLKQIGKKSGDGWALRVDSDGEAPPAEVKSLLKSNKEYWKRQENRFREELRAYDSFCRDL